MNYDFENMNARDRLTRSEHEINAARLKREQQERDEAREVRSRLERASPSGARRGLVALLNGMEHGQTASPNLDFMNKLRADQDLGRRTASQHNAAHTRFEKKYGVHSAPSSYNFKPGEPENNPRGSRFEADQRYDPPRSAGKIRDVDGSMNSDKRTRRDHWDGQGVHGVDAEFLLAVARALIAMVNSREHSRGDV